MFPEYLKFLLVLVGFELQVLLLRQDSRLILVAANKSALTAKEPRGKNSDSS